MGMELDFSPLLVALEERLVDSSSKSFGDLVYATAATKNREIFVGDIEYGTGSDVDALIRHWNHIDKDVPVEERQPIKLFINSYGGNLMEAFTMADSIKMSKTPVWTICCGCAYSGGFLTYIMGHKRFAYPTASFLFHEGSTAMNGIDAGKFRNYADFYDVQLSQLKQHVINNTGITDKEYEKHKKDDWWMTADDGVKYGCVDEITKELM